MVIRFQVLGVPDCISKALNLRRRHAVVVPKSLLTAGALLAAFCVAGASLGLATTLLKADVPTLARASASVVQARVLDTQSAWNADHTMIFTQVTLGVTRTLRGRSQSRIVVRVPGGTADGFTIEMAGAPKFQRGSSVVAFIGRWDDGAAKVVGYAQGLSRVVPDRLGNLILQGGVAKGLPLSQLIRQLAQVGPAGGGQ
jgi:hypothetical protein